MTTQAIQKNEHQKFMGKVESREQTWQRLLPEGLKASWFIGEVRVAVARAPKLLQCDEVSVFDALTTCAQLGLSPSGRLGSAYLIPYGAKCTLVIGYRGYVDLAFRSGDVSAFHAVTVHAKDVFHYEEGLAPSIKHVPTEEDEPGPLRAVYAMARMKDGSAGFCVMLRRDVLPIRNTALSKKRQGAPPTPWETSEGEMWKKTAVRRLIKLLPLSPTRAKGLFDAETAEREQEDAMDVGFTVQEEQPTTGVAGAKAALKARNRETLEISSEPTEEQKAAILAAEMEQGQ